MPVTDDSTGVRRVLVTGATGYIGGRLVPELLGGGLRGAMPGPVAGEAGGPSVVATGSRWWRVTSSDRAAAWRRWSTSTPRTTSCTRWARPRSSQNVTGPGRRRSGTRRRVPGSRSSCTSVGSGDDDAALSEHLSSRHDVGAVLAEGPVPVTELRAAVIIGSGSASFEMLRHLTDVLPAMVTPRWVRTRCQPIAIRDVLAYLVGVLGDDRRARQGAGDRRSRRRHLRGDDAALRRRRRSTTEGRGAACRCCRRGLSSYWVGSGDAVAGRSRPGRSSTAS